MIVNINSIPPKKYLSLPNCNIPITPIPLQRSEPTSPYCYSASLTPVNDESLSLPLGTNFLATQVWPSSRTASFILQRHCNPLWTVCEFGCGPGLPSLTAASLGATVIATDVDTTALQMVQLAAQEQGFVNDGRFVTQWFDLTSQDTLPEADLYVLSDVFESSSVATGAARHVKTLLDGTDNSKVWVFAQSDRAQREVFLKSLQEIDGYDDLEWTINHEPEEDARIWLFDLNEMDVQYN